MNLLEIFKTVVFASVIVVIVGFTAIAVMFLNPTKPEDIGRVAGVVDSSIISDVTEINDYITIYTLDLGELERGETRIDLDKVETFGSIVTKVLVTGRVQDDLGIEIAVGDSETIIFPNSEFTELESLAGSDSDIDLILSAKNAINFPFRVELTLYR